MRATFATEEFPWEELDEHDYICKVGGYIFNVWKINSENWNYTVYHNSQPITYDQFTKSKFTAIGRCEGIYYGHSLTKFSQN